MNKWKTISIALMVVLAVVTFFAYTSYDELQRSKKLVASTQLEVDNTKEELITTEDELAAVEDERAILTNKNSLYSSCVDDLMSVDTRTYPTGVFIYTRDIKPVLICFDNVQNGVNPISEPVDSI